MAKEKVIALCSPHQGHIVAVTDKGKVVTATSMEDFEEKVSELK